MNSKTISVENLGPIAAMEFAIESPGVTVLVAPNGSGKTILLEAVQAAARGEGKLPLRDRTKRGKVEAFGATITIGGTCRHTGGVRAGSARGGASGSTRLAPLDGDRCGGGGRLG